MSPGFGEEDRYSASRFHTLLWRTLAWWLLAERPPARHSEGLIAAVPRLARIAPPRSNPGVGIWRALLLRFVLGGVGSLHRAKPYTPRSGLCVGYGREQCECFESKPRERYLQGLMKPVHDSFVGIVMILECRSEECVEVVQVRRRIYSCMLV